MRPGHLMASVDDMAECQAGLTMKLCWGGAGRYPQHSTTHVKPHCRVPGFRLPGPEMALFPNCASEPDPQLI